MTIEKPLVSTLPLVVALVAAVLGAGCEGSVGDPVDSGRRLDGALANPDGQSKPADAGLTLVWRTDAGDGAVDGGEFDGGEFDGGEPDGGEFDGGEPDGALIGMDGALDSGAVVGDAGALDGATLEPDSALPDVGAPDSGFADSGRPDSGIPDSGIPDSGRPDSGIPDSGRPDTGVDAAEPECRTHGDCDDGLFCNGAETCVGGVCVVGTPPSCNDSDACTNDSCSEAIKQCVHVIRPCALPNASATCVAGACTVTTCSAGYGDCNANSVDGCEAPLDTNTHCGSCLSACSTTCPGGTCSPGGRGDPCVSDSGCTTGHCRAGRCVIGPSAGFRLTPASGTVPVVVTATNTATAGDAALASIRYDWGSGFGSAESFQFTQSGSHTVRQQVVDTSGLSSITSLVFNATSFVPASLSHTDLTQSTVVRDDGLTVEMRNYLGISGGVRSETGIAPGQGVFYFEVSKLTIDGAYGYGVMAVDAPFTSHIGEDDQSFGVSSDRAVYYGGSALFEPDYSPAAGFVIDYRGSSPTVYAIYEVWGEPVIRAQPMPAVNNALHAAFIGLIPSHGPIVKFNFGSDTTNHPFHFDPDALLRSSGAGGVADALVLGLGQTRARARSTAPVLTPSATALTVAVNTPVSLTASANDAEDGSLTSAIHWELESDSYYIRRTATGGSFGFTPDEIGIYPVLLRVADSFDVETTRRVMVTVTGTLPQFDPVRLVTDQYTGSGIVVAPDGLRVRYTVDHKNAMRANQGAYGQFWYYEVSRLVAPRNIGCGAVIRRGSLDPLDFLSTQPSFQVNFLGSVWWDLIFQHNPPQDPTFGFAIDYRGIHPIVHIIASSGVVWSRELPDVWLPFYPIVYGNGIPSSRSDYDQRINFGATPFVYNAEAILSAAGIDTAGFQQGWGNANTP